MDFRQVFGRKHGKIINVYTLDINDNHENVTCICGCRALLELNETSTKNKYFTLRGILPCVYEGNFCERTVMSFVKDAIRTFKISPARNLQEYGDAMMEDENGTSRGFHFHEEDNTHLLDVNSPFPENTRMILRHGTSENKHAIQIWDWKTKLSDFGSVSNRTQTIPETWRGMPLSHVHAGNIVSNIEMYSSPLTFKHHCFNVGHLSAQHDCEENICNFCFQKEVCQKKILFVDKENATVSFSVLLIPFDQWPTHEEKTCYHVSCFRFLQHSMKKVKNYHSL